MPQKIENFDRILVFSYILIYFLGLFASKSQIVANSIQYYTNFHKTSLNFIENQKRMAEGGNYTNNPIPPRDYDDGFERCYYRTRTGHGAMFFDERRLPNGDLILKVYSKQERQPFQRHPGESPRGRKYALRCRRLAETMEDENDDAYVCELIPPQQEQRQPLNDQNIDAQRNVNPPAVQRRLNFNVNDRTFNIPNSPGQRDANANRSPQEFIPFESVETLPPHIRDAYMRIINEENQRR